MAKSNKQQVTSLAQLKKYSEGAIINLPPFGPEMPFVARVRRPSMMGLASKGKIPNSLLSTANTLFAKGSGSMDINNEEMMNNMLKLMEIIAEETLVEPSLTEIEEAGLTLSDDQYLAIFMYTQEGIQSVAPFPEEAGNLELAGDV